MVSNERAGEDFMRILGSQRIMMSLGGELDSRSSKVCVGWMDGWMNDMNTPSSQGSVGRSDSIAILKSPTSPSTHADSRDTRREETSFQSTYSAIMC